MLRALRCAGPIGSVGIGKADLEPEGLVFGFRVEEVFERSLRVAVEVETTLKALALMVFAEDSRMEAFVLEGIDDGGFPVGEGDV